jgi:hypothetical protein
MLMPVTRPSSRRTSNTENGRLRIESIIDPALTITN